MDPSVAEKAILLISRGSGVLSVLSVICTFLEATAEWRTKGKHTSVMARIQSVLQGPLFLHATVHVLGTTPAPKDGGVWLARGNEASCSMQGVVLLGSTSAAILLDAFLSFTYLLLIQYGWREADMPKVERVAYVVIFLYAIGFSVFCLANSLFGHVFEVCFLAIPESCDEQEFTNTIEPDSAVTAGWTSSGTINEWPVGLPDRTSDCEPTPDVLAIARLVVLAVNMLHLVFSLYVAARLYFVALAVEAPAHVSRRVAVKGLLFALAIALIQMPVAIWVITYFALGRSLVFFEFFVAAVIPLAGFMNMFVFQLNRKEMRTSYGRGCKRVLDFFGYGFRFGFVQNLFAEEGSRNTHFKSSRAVGARNDEARGGGPDQS